MGLEEHAEIGDRKADFSGIYTEPDPRAYFATLNPLDYQVAQQALPVIEAVLDATKREGRDRTVLDLCCSYGINSAMLYHPDVPDKATGRYTDPNMVDLSSDELAAADRELYADRRRDVAVLGVDTSAPAIRYAVQAGLLADGWAENLEQDAASERLAAGVRETGVLICTGGFGYIRRPTFEKLLSVINEPRDLWLVVCVLRVFDYTPVIEFLDSYGLVTERLPGTFKQRRFADQEEQEAALHDIDLRGLDPTGKEADGWFHGECFVTRPAAAPLPDLSAALTNFS